MFPIYSCRCVVRTTVSRRGTITLSGSHLKAGEAQSWFVFLTFRIKNFGTRILHSGCAFFVSRNNCASLPDRLASLYGCFASNCDVF